MKLVPVTRPPQVRQFLRLAYQVHRDAYSLWVPPLQLHLRALMGRVTRPDRRFYLALVDGQPVARIGVKRHSYQGEERLHFGFFECLPGHAQAARALVEEAHRMAPGLPLVGPYHFRQEDPYTGLLVKGFDREPCFLMAYNPPYYEEYLKRAGLEAVMDLHSYRFTRANVRLAGLLSRAEKAQAAGVRVRTLDPRRREPEIRALAGLFNEALRDNWGFEEFTRSHVRELHLLSYLVLDPRWVFLAHCGDRLVGAGIMLPDYNPLLRHSGGRLNAALLGRLLRRDRAVQAFRGWAIAVKEEARPLDAAAAILHAGWDRLRDGPWRAVEFGWVLASNRPMNAFLRALGDPPHKIHRILERRPLS